MPGYVSAAALRVGGPRALPRTLQSSSLAMVVCSALTSRRRGRESSLARRRPVFVRSSRIKSSCVSWKQIAYPPKRKAEWQRLTQA